MFGVGGGVDWHCLALYRCGHSLVLGLFERVELLFLAAQLRRLGKDSASYKRPSLMYLP